MSETSSSMSQENALGLFELSPVPAWIHHRHTLAFLEVNAAAIREFGYTREEFRSRTIADLRAEPDRERLLEMLEREASGPRTRGPWALLHEDGSSALYDLTATDVFVDGQPGVFVIVYPVAPEVAHIAALAADQHRAEMLMTQVAVCRGRRDVRGATVVARGFRGHLIRIS